MRGPLGRSEDQLAADLKAAAENNIAGLYPVLDAPKRKMVPAKKAEPTAPQAPSIYKVEAIRAAKRTEVAVN